MKNTFTEIKEAMQRKVFDEIDAATINHHIRRGTMSRDKAIETVAHNFSVDFQREMDWPELTVEEAIRLGRFIDSCAENSVDIALAREEAFNQGNGMKFKESDRKYIEALNMFVPVFADSAEKIRVCDTDRVACLANEVNDNLPGFYQYAKKVMEKWNPPLFYAWQIWEGNRFTAKHQPELLTHDEAMEFADYEDRQMKQWKN